MHIVSGPEDLVRRLLRRGSASSVPRDAAIDSTFAMLREGYPFIWNRCQRYKSDIFTARVLGKPAVCIHGPEAARVFYDQTKLRRSGAVPRRVVTTLFGKKAVQTLDDEAHRHRKAALMSIMTPASLERLMRFMTEQWQLAITRWESERTVVLFDEAQRILTAAACEWVGVPLEADEVAPLAKQLGAMVDAFGGVGLRLWRGKAARASAQRWLAKRARDVRSHDLVPEHGTALDILTRYRDARGKRLRPRVVAVELLNLIRPTSAIAWYIADAAHALHQHPEERRKLTSGETLDVQYATMFMHEVRRLYPFTPYLGAKVRVPFDWRGHEFRPGTLVLLDVYGANHDPKIWLEPDRFAPERFLSAVDSAFEFIPQGGGSALGGHRCAGEDVTTLSLTLALRFLTRAMSYNVVPGQDLTIDLSRMPARPRSGVVLEKVRATSEITMQQARSAEPSQQNGLDGAPQPRGA